MIPDSLRQETRFFRQRSTCKSVTPALLSVISICRVPLALKSSPTRSSSSNPAFFSCCWRLSSASMPEVPGMRAEITNIPSLFVIQMHPSLSFMLIYISPRTGTIAGRHYGIMNRLVSTKEKPHQSMGQMCSFASIPRLWNSSSRLSCRSDASISSSALRRRLAAAEALPPFLPCSRNFLRA